MSNNNNNNNCFLSP